MESNTLTNQCRSDSVCDRCTIPLRLSIWEGVKVFYTTGKSKNQGFLCDQCATRSISKRVKPSATIQDLDDYVSRKLYPKIRSYHN